jgi:SPP1 family predicted phage head-tail adaptor
MDKLITLKSRDIDAPAEDSVDYAESFASLGSEWAQIMTIQRGPVLFDGTNTLRQVTHIFRLRYRADVTAETWVEYEDDNYAILNVENLEERNEFMYLYCFKRGSKALAVNQL